MSKLTFDILMQEAQKHGLLLERIDRTINGVRFLYEITEEETGVWERCSTLEQVQQEVNNWENKEVFFIV